MTSDASSVDRPHGRPASSRSLAPREHGAYGQLALPLTTALAMGAPGPAAVSLAVAACFVFLLHEPLLVAIGARGARARRENGARARKRALMLAVGALAFGGPGLALASLAARLAALGALALAAVLVAFIRAGDEKTTTGEVVAALALCSASLPVALASGVPLRTALSATLAWVIAFSASTLAVRSVIAHAKAPSGPVRRIAGPTFVSASAGTLVAGGALLPFSAVSITPMLVLALALAARPPETRRLRAVGWSLVAASVATAVAMIVLART